MPAKKRITESEYEILKVMWDAGEPMSAPQITEKLKEKGWQRTTVATLLTRLCEKDGAAFETRGLLLPEDERERVQTERDKVAYRARFRRFGEKSRCGSLH